MVKKLATFVFRSQDPETDEVVYSFVEHECCPKGNVSEGIKGAAKTRYGCKADIVAEHFKHTEIKCHNKHFEVVRVDCIPNR